MKISVERIVRRRHADFSSKFLYNQQIIISNSWIDEQSYHCVIFFVFYVVLQYEECRLRCHKSSICELIVIVLLFDERFLDFDVRWDCVVDVSVNVSVNVDSSRAREIDRFLSTLKALLDWLLNWLLLISTTLTLRCRDDDDMLRLDSCDNVRFSVISSTAYLFVFKCIIFFRAFTFFWDKIEKKQKNVWDVSIFW
jgi:hypothetical protein